MKKFYTMHSSARQLPISILKADSSLFDLASQYNK